jgi:hypothetical protein
MIANKTLITTNNVKNNTYFIHVKKNKLNDANDLTVIKNLLEEKLNEDIFLDDLNIINKSDLAKISYKNIGKYLKSNKKCECNSCNDYIINGTIFKQLDCMHRFHTHCIDPLLKKDLYKKCSVCNTEHVSNYI